MFQSVQKQVLPDQIFEQIRDQILLGHLKAGETLPSERKLCTLFSVNRGSIREALKKLQQGGLIQIQHGGKTQILDFYQNASISLLPDLLFIQGHINAEVVYSVLELRLALGQDVVRLCALRMNSDQIEQLHQCVQQMQGTQDPSQKEIYSIQFWHYLVSGSNNIAYQLAFNTLSKTFQLMRTSLHDLLIQEWENTDAFRSLTLAIQNQNPQDAQKVIQDFLTSPQDAQDFLDHSSS